MIRFGFILLVLFLEAEDFRFQKNFRQEKSVPTGALSSFIKNLKQEIFRNSYTYCFTKIEVKRMFINIHIIITVRRIA